VHRDIKLENILLKDKDDDVDFLLADFGMAA
jgi:serine/threonine protein kinase